MAHTISIDFDQNSRSGTLSGFVAIGETVTFKANVPDNTGIGLFACNGETLASGIFTGGTAVVNTATVPAVAMFGALPPEATSNGAIQVGNTDSLVCVCPCELRKNWNYGLVPPAVDVPKYPSTEDLKKLLAALKESEANAKASAAAAEVAKTEAVSARSDALAASTAAGQSAQNASSSAANAALYRNQAQIYARNAKKSEDAAKDSAYWADVSNQDATARASEAADSAAAAHKSETAAKVDAGEAKQAAADAVAAKEEAVQAEIDASAEAALANADAQAAKADAASAKADAEIAKAEAGKAKTSAESASSEVAKVPALLAKKQDTLTAGDGITIAPDGKISAHGALSEDAKKRVSASIDYAWDRGTTYLSDYAFSGDTLMRSFYTTNGSYVIGKFAFAESAIEEIAFANMRGVHEGAFLNCTKLTVFREVPGRKPQPKFIGTIAVRKEDKIEGAFRGCISLVNVDVLTNSDSLETIGDSAFSECINILSVTIGKNVKEIGSNAFLYANTLAVVRFSDGFAGKISRQSFWIVPKLKEIYFPSNASAWAGVSNSFGASNLKDAYAEGETFEDLKKNHGEFPWGFPATVTLHCKDGDFKPDGTPVLK